MKLKFIFIIIFALHNVYSQEVSVTLNFNNTPDSIAIVASKSINEDAGYFLSHTDTIFTKNNKAELKFNSINSGHLYLSFSKANPGISLLFEPNESISLDVSRNPDNKYHIHYVGKNSALLLLINTDTIYKYPLFAKKLRKVIYEADGPSDILLFIKNEYKVASSKLQTLHDTQKISSDIFPVAKLHLESTLAYNAKGIIEDIFRIEEEYLKTKLSKSEFTKLLNDVMSEFYLFDDKFKSFASFAFFDGLQSTAKFVEESGSSAKIYDSNFLLHFIFKH